VIIEADEAASCKSSGASECNDSNRGWLQAASIICLVIFCLEVLLRLIAAEGEYFKVPWNLFDLGIVVLGVICEIVGSLLSFVVYIRVLRIVRLFRTVRILVTFRELYIIMHGMVSTLRAIWWAFVLMACLLAMWSVFAVEVLHQYNLKIPYDKDECPRCKYAFGSVWQAMVTLFQTVVIGDDWGQVVIPLVDRYPLTSMIFLGLHFTVALGLVNLILAVIVDKAAEAREEDAKAISSMRENKQRQAKRSLVKLCMEMDVDKSGSLTLDELMDGFRNSRGFRSVLDVLDVDKEDLECVFRIMDQDRSGDVSYCEFVDLLYRMKTQNSKTLLMFIKHYVLELRADVAQQLGLLKGEIMSNIKQNHEDTAALRRGFSMIERVNESTDLDLEIVDLDDDLDASARRPSVNVIEVGTSDSKQLNTDKAPARASPSPALLLPGAVCSSPPEAEDASKASQQTSSSNPRARPKKSKTVTLKKRVARQPTHVQYESQGQDEQQISRAWEPAEQKAEQPTFGSEAEEAGVSRPQADTAATQTERTARPLVVQPGAPPLSTPVFTEKWSLREELDRLARDIEVQLATAAQRAEQQHAVLLQSLITAAAVAAEGAGSSLAAGAAIGNTGSTGSVNVRNGSSTGGSAEAICCEEISGEEATADGLWSMAYPMPGEPP